MSQFKLSLTDIDSTKPSDYSVNRLYPNPKIALDRTPAHIGILNIDVVSGPSYANGSITTWYSFKHGYDYRPTVVGVFVAGTEGFSDGGILPYSGFGGLGQMFMDADEKNVYVKWESFDASATPLGTQHLRIRYYIFAEEALQTIA